MWTSTIQLQSHLTFFFFFLMKAYLFIYFWLCWVFISVRAFSSCGEWGPVLIAVRGPLTVAAPLVAEHKLQTRRLSSCGSRAQSLRGMWGPPRPGLEPVSPASAGRLSTTAPPGKPPNIFINKILDFIFYRRLHFTYNVYFFISLCQQTFSF